jgi:phosphomannomutase
LAQVDAAFIASSIENASFNTPAEAKENLNVVFTSLHGTSTLVPDTLSAGYTNVHIVPEQASKRRFPNRKISKSRRAEALAMALALADKTNADIVIGTDPDCDRLVPQ